MKRLLFASLLALSLGTSLYAQPEFAPQTMLKPKFTGLYSIPPNLDARTAYDLLGSRAGINIVFYPSFKAETGPRLKEFVYPPL